MASQTRRILILCKTYPSPSARYAETSCVAGIEEGGKLIRLYPMPFRLVTDAAQFKKWQWIEARVERARDDRRPESHRIYVDTIRLDGEPLGTGQSWRERRAYLDRFPLYSDFEAIEAARQMDDTSLALLRPSRLIELKIVKAKSSDWTDEERAKLLQMQRQGSLFEEDERPALRLLKKLPFDFYYRYECSTPSGPRQYEHKIVDWEAGALFWNVRRKHGPAWEQPFRDKLERGFAARDLYFLMGNIHRFPDQWLIVSLIYPPRREVKPPSQEGLQRSLL